MGSEMAVDGVGNGPLSPDTSSDVPTGASPAGVMDPATARQAGSNPSAPTITETEATTVGDGGAPLSPSVSPNQSQSQSKPKDFGSGTTAILTAPPPGPDSQVVAPSIQPAATSSTSNPQPSAQPKLQWKPKPKADSAPAWRKNAGTASSLPTPSQSQSPSQTASNTAKPHPIQGGRKGPIGLANPPPVEKPKAKLNDKSKQGGASKPAPAAATPEPRVRKEVKIREGGATDLSSLASRVKNLVIANTVGSASPGGAQKGEKA
jgi:hypothetical protein